MIKNIARRPRIWAISVFAMLPLIASSGERAVLTAAQVVVKDGVYLARDTGNKISGRVEIHDEKGLLVSRTDVSEGLPDGSVEWFHPKSIGRTARFARGQPTVMVVATASSSNTTATAGLYGR
jgi:hypothetical protein